MLFTYPSFIGTKEQSQSDLLFNSIRMVIQTNVREIWYDLDFGTKIRDLIKQGIDDITIMEIQDDITSALDKYFSNDIIVNTLDIYQDLDKLKINLDYTEVRTGKHYTMQTEDVIVNEDRSLY